MLPVTQPPTTIAGNAGSGIIEAQEFMDIIPAGMKPSSCLTNPLQSIQSSHLQILDLVDNL